MRTVEDFVFSAKNFLDEKAMNLFKDEEAKYIASEKEVEKLKTASSMSFSQIDDLRTGAGCYKLLSWGYYNKAKEFEENGDEVASDFCKDEAIIWKERQDKRTKDCLELDERFSTFQSR